MREQMRYPHLLHEQRSYNLRHTSCGPHRKCMIPIMAQGRGEGVFSSLIAGVVLRVEDSKPVCLGWSPS